jgi:hypothetical protein
MGVTNVSFEYVTRIQSVTIDKSRSMSPGCKTLAGYSDKFDAVEGGDSIPFTRILIHITLAPLLSW